MLNYTNAIQVSRNGPFQYILSKSGDSPVTLDGNQKDSILRLLREGYIIEAVANNGVLERTFNTTEEAIIDTISELVQANWAGRNGLLHIATQEFYDKAGTSEGVYMYMSFFPAGVFTSQKNKAENLLVTPKDTLADKAAYEAGQERAKKVLDAIALHSGRFTHGETSVIRVLEKRLGA